ncbi:MAG: 30S ribosomal protein S15 [Bdellovibrionales bacterium]|nr:30S ribosomal protein S15 [Bdellovibrionales bacterium]
MAFLASQKQEIVKKFRQSELDTGSSHVQVALLTHRINHLTEHFKKNKKDVHGQRGLLKLVNRRRKLLDYLRSQDSAQYSSLIAELGLRK